MDRDISPVVSAGDFREIDNKRSALSIAAPALYFTMKHVINKVIDDAETKTGKSFTPPGCKKRLEDPCL